MIDRIEVRCGQHEGGGVRVIVDIGSAEATFQVWLDDERTVRRAPRERIAAIESRLERAVVAPVARHPSGGPAVGYEVTLTAGMTQSIYRWVASTPTGWEPIASAADELLELARSLAAVD